MKRRACVLSTSEPPQAPGWGLALLAGLPVALCLVVMGVPALAAPSHALAFRLLYLLACVAWVPCLVLLQRWLWRRGTGILATGAVLLLASYAMAVANNGLGMALAARMGWAASTPARWSALLSGVDGCWLALVAYCAAHAAMAHALSLRDERRRRREAVLLAQQAELRALRDQLQPHFLFNALNGLSTLVAEGRIGPARAMIAHLGTLLRATLETTAHEVVLAEELALAETYLAIEQARLGARLQVHWQVGPGTLDAQVPFLLLQPLIENAIRHGIAPRRAPGRLHLTVQRQGAQLRIELRNDLPEANAVAGPPVQAGLRLGQHNVAERLARLYPGRAGLEIVDGGGTYAVSIHLPFLAVADEAAA